MSTRPFAPSSSILSSRTDDRPIGFGRKGERVANTPIRTFPPSRGGLTVGDQWNSDPGRVGVPLVAEKPQISQIWEKPSRPRSASGTR